MGRVTGIGGIFFRADDPAGLAAWYEEHLGITRTPASYGEKPWRQEGGPKVFAPFPADTEYFGASQSWMLNLRVESLDTMVEHVRGVDIEVTVDEAVYPNGRFARLYDPEGNPIELWEPAEPS